MTEYCGSEDTATGDPCQRPAGWGTDRTTGYCRTHEAGGEEPGGRDPKLTKERQEAICSAIEDGKSVTSAARMAGVAPSTVYAWIDRGEDQTEGIYAEFSERFARARGHGEDFYVTSAIRLAQEEGDLATLMSMLKQRYPESWGDVDRGEQAGSGIQLFNSAPENIDELVEALTEH